MRAVWWWATEMVPVPRALALGLYLYTVVHAGTWLLG